MEIERELYKLRELGYFKNFEDKESYYLVTCPFHNNGNEKTPSFSINKERVKTRDNGYIESGYVHCFGCGYKNRFTKFLADVKGVTEMEILKEEYKDKIYLNKRELNLDYSKSEVVQAINYTPLELSLEGRGYLNNRKISNNTIGRFRISSDIYNNIVFPLCRKDGQVIGVQTRSITKKAFYNTKGLDKKHLLYGLHELKSTEYLKGEKLYITESIIDTLTLWSWGYKAVALMGAKFSEYHIKELIKLPYDLVLSLDNDSVGKNAMREVEGVFKRYGKKISLLKWGNTIEKDINDLNKEKFIKIKER